MEYEAVIGLETHVQLKTRSKMWCACPNRFGEPPNTLVCPICLGLPGVLPVPNEEAIRLTLLTGMLLHCELPPLARFDRKSYFYPDVPKNYQITQYELPSTRNGYVEFEFQNQLHRVRIKRAHLEEDVGKSFHFERHSGLDFNRAGVPLLEIVSEPDITSADMAYAYLTALKEILVQGGISDCDMEKGMVRCDVNVSIRPKGSDRLGAKIEIKNMNSFSGVRRALEYEIGRQIAVLQSGGTLTQSTRRWDELTGTTEEMRSKEEAHDYRYFPDPDLLPLAPEPVWLESLRSRRIELPLDRKRRLMQQYGLPAQDAEVFKSDPALAQYFEALAPNVRTPKLLANWIINNLRAQLAELHSQQIAAAQATDPDAPAPPPPSLDSLRFPPDALAELIELVENRTLSSSAAQAVFAEMFATGRRPREIVEEKGLAQVSDPAQLEQLCEQVLAAHPGPAEDYRRGKAAALNFLKGQVMKLSRGKANPVLVGEILERKLRA
ncbi:MAG: Asp-tRNA(Asn)/Glu-tRNA(Gln) amidotransferase subunit GatB [Verrucomicrobiota bacterium]|nr:Asp-tRNA(Asn)/Glu-tRNA(Gln) amidotransferase subunit GatB [Limisphaera sp.]MDW8382018.1 Asp-tRNA(Asn)/Glu-tRNA(Gln) amidotransferase subunit GatB [Verrucomicrobiota bacterium]